MKKSIFKIAGAVAIALVVLFNINVKSANAADKLKQADQRVDDYSFYCCLGWGTACNVNCVNVPGEKEKFFWE